VRNHTVQCRILLSMPFCSEHFYMCPISTSYHSFVTSGHPSCMCPCCRGYNFLYHCLLRCHDSVVFQNNQSQTSYSSTKAPIMFSQNWYFNVYMVHNQIQDFFFYPKSLICIPSAWALIGFARNIITNHSLWYIKIQIIQIDLNYISVIIH
jgi:hypothetical protein